MKNDVKNTAHAVKYENGETCYELVHWPVDHDCAPSATSHLKNIFRDRCFTAVENDPTKSVFQIYKEIRTELGQNLEPDDKISFLCEIPKLHSIRVQLYNHRRNFIPKSPEDFVSFYYVYDKNYML